MTPEQLEIKNVGKQDPKRHLEEDVDKLMTNNITQCLGSMIDTVVFKQIMTKKILHYYQINIRLGRTPTVTMPGGTA